MPLRYTNVRENRQLLRTLDRIDAALNKRVEQGHAVVHDGMAIEVGKTAPYAITMMDLRTGKTTPLGTFACAVRPQFQFDLREAGPALLCPGSPATLELLTWQGKPARTSSRAPLRDW